MKDYFKNLGRWYPSISLHIVIITLPFFYLNAPNCVYYRSMVPHHLLTPHPIPFQSFFPIPPCLPPPFQSLSLYHPTYPNPSNPFSLYHPSYPLPSNPFSLYHPSYTLLLIPFLYTTHLTPSFQSLFLIPPFLPPPFQSLFPIPPFLHPPSNPLSQYHPSYPLPSNPFSLYHPSYTLLLIPFPYTTLLTPSLPILFYLSPIFSSLHILYSYNNELYYSLFKMSLSVNSIVDIIRFFLDYITLMFSWSFVYVKQKNLYNVYLRCIIRTSCKEQCTVLWYPPP